MDEEIKKLIKALEAGMYDPRPSPRAQRLCLMLSKLGVKTARDMLPIGLHIEGLEATLRSITFEDRQIKLWKDLQK
jgi:hypothetical protein